MFNKIQKIRTSVNFQSNNPGFLELIKHSLKKWIKWIFIVNLLFFTCITRIAFIPSSSMTPTVQVNDLVCSSSLSFGFSPINFGSLLRNFNIPFLNIKPKHGDSIAFYDKHNYNMVFCKRIIGCPGDRIKIRNGFVILNGKPISLNYIGYYTFMENDRFTDGLLYEETMPNGVKHYIFKYEGLDYFQDNTPEFVIPKGYYFGMGDNRNNSLDSRCELGFIEEKHMLGRVYMILFSNGNLLSFNVWKFMNGIRLDRCFHWIS